MKLFPIAFARKLAQALFQVFEGFHGGTSQYRVICRGG
jgi:hypothetical protein